MPSLPTGSYHSLGYPHPCLWDAFWGVHEDLYQCGGYRGVLKVLQGLLRRMLRQRRKELSNPSLGRGRALNKAPLRLRCGAGGGQHWCVFAGRGLESITSSSLITRAGARRAPCEHTGPP